MKAYYTLVPPEPDPLTNSSFQKADASSGVRVFHKHGMSRQATSPSWNFVFCFKHDMSFLQCPKQSSISPWT